MVNQLVIKGESKYIKGKLNEINLSNNQNLPYKKYPCQTFEN